MPDKLYTFHPESLYHQYLYKNNPYNQFPKILSQITSENQIVNQFPKILSQITSEKLNSQFYII